MEASAFKDICDDIERRLLAMANALKCLMDNMNLQLYPESSCVTKCVACKRPADITGLSNAQGKPSVGKKKSLGTQSKSTIARSNGSGSDVGTTMFPPITDRKNSSVTASINPSNDDGSAAGTTKLLITGRKDSSVTASIKPKISAGSATETTRLPSITVRKCFSLKPSMNPRLQKAASVRATDIGADIFKGIPPDSEIKCTELLLAQERAEKESQLSKQEVLPKIGPSVETIEEAPLPLSKSESTDTKLVAMKYHISFEPIRKIEDPQRNQHLPESAAESEKQENSDEGESDSSFGLTLEIVLRIA